MTDCSAQYKRPESVLVVVYRADDGRALLLKRTDHPDFWQSVTGSLRWDETDPVQTAVREVREETGLSADDLIDLKSEHTYTILPEWRHRYAPGITENTEHAFALCVPGDASITLNPAEHSDYCWLPFVEASRRVWSWSNRDAIVQLMQRLNRA